MSDVFTGQVERDPHGGLWAVLYRGEVIHADAIVNQEPTRSVKQGVKRVEEMILAQADAENPPSGLAAASGPRHHAGRHRQALARNPRPTPS